MISVLLLWLVPGVCWLWERGAFDGFSRRTSNRKLALFAPFFLLLLVYAQKPQNQPQLTLPSGQQLVVVNTPAMQMSQQSGELMSAELKLSGAVPVVFTNSVWSGWTNGTVYEPWVTVPVRKGVAELELPFAFPVGTNVYSNIYVSASGVIGFDRPRGSVVPAALPCAYGTNGVFLALAWGDNMFKPGLGSRLYYGIESNSFCVLMDDVFAGTNVFSAKVELFDNGNIVLKYRDLPADHTIGLQNFSGGWQVATNGTFELFCRYFGWADPSKIDTDDDGLSDYDEVYVYGTDPRTSDTDGDGLSDADEIALGYNPTNADSNGDGFSDLLDSQGVSSTSDPLVISRVLDGYAVDDASYVPTAVISNDAVLVTTRLDLPEGAPPVGAMVSVAGKMIPILNGVTFSHVVAVVPDSENLIEYAPSNLPAGSTVTIEIGAHRFGVLNDPNGVVTRFYSIGSEEGMMMNAMAFGMPASAGTGAAALSIPVMRIEPEVVCAHGDIADAEVVMRGATNYTYNWTASPSGSIDVNGAVKVRVAPGFKRSQTGTVSAFAMPKQGQAAGDYKRTASVPLRFCPNTDEEEREPGDDEYTVDPEYHNCPNNCSCHAAQMCPKHHCYYSQCPKDTFDQEHTGYVVFTNFVEGTVLFMDENKWYSTVAVSVPEPLTNCCPCPSHTGVYTWVLPNWRLRAYDSAELINEIDRLERRDGYVYVKGVAPSKEFGDAHLTIAPRTGDVTVHEYTVFGLQLHPDFDGDGSISDSDRTRRLNSEIWKVQAGFDRQHKIVFRTDVLLPFGMVKVSLEGAPDGARLVDSHTNEICTSGMNFTKALSGWRQANEPALKDLYLESPIPGSGVIVFEFMTVKDGKSYRCEKRQRFTAYQVTAEPISSEKTEGSVMNPAGIAVGATAVYKVDVTPAVDESKISWKVNSGPVVLQNTTGLQVTIQASSPAWTTFEIEAEIDGVPLKQRAVFTGTVLELKKTPVTVWIVRQDNGMNPAIEDLKLFNLFSEINKIYSQVGMTFELIHPINHTNKTDWLDLSMTNSLSNPGVEQLIGQQPNVADGLELYFVRSITDCNTSSNTSWDLGGFHLTNGIVIGREEGVYTTSARTIAHEIGHACGLSDIYVDQGGVSVDPSMLVSVDSCPYDYGLYPYNLTQWDIIPRLLMYGEVLDTAITIPRGAILGVKKVSTGVFTNSSVSVGLNTPLNRQPKSQ